MSRSLDLDRVGAVASLACALHCAAIPILVSLSAGGVLSIIDNRPVEWGLVLLAGAVGTVSAWRGYRQHGNKTVALVLAVAALGLVLATGFRPDVATDDPEQFVAWLSRGAAAAPSSTDRLVTWIFPLMGVVIAVAHLVNLRLCRACRACDAHEHAPVPSRT
jgi:hypothetical protein